MLSKIKSIEEITSNSLLYDIETETGNFFANNILVHNSSSTFIWNNGEFIVCSRNQTVKSNPPNLYWEIADRYHLFENMTRYNENIAIQGEIVGPGIQSNRMGLKDKQLFVFNIYFIDHRRYANFSEFIWWCDKLGLQTVPIIDKGETFNYNIDQLTVMSNEHVYSTNGHQQEGIVVRPQTEMYSETIKGRLSFKVISSEYLLKIDK